MRTASAGDRIALNCYNTLVCLHAGTCKFRVRDLPQDAGVTGHRFTLLFDGPGCNVDPKNMAGNSLLVKNKFVMTSEVTTKVCGVVSSCMPPTSRPILSLN